MRFIESVRARKSPSSLRSTASVLDVAAPVIPSLNAPVISEFISRTLRFSLVRVRLKYTENSATIGTIANTHTASNGCKINMTTAEPITYIMFHTLWLTSHAIMDATDDVSLMTRA